MELINRSNFDLAFDIKTISDLEQKINLYENPMHLLKLMMKEIRDLNNQLETANRKLNKCKKGL